MIKDTISNPTPKTIREFKNKWLKEEFRSYSDKDIKKLLIKLLAQGKNCIIIGYVPIN